MECCAAALAAACSKVVETIGGPVCSKAGDVIDYHRNLEKYMDKFKSRLDELNGRKQDVVSIIELRPGKEVKAEVEIWLANVEKINNDKIYIEREFEKTSCFKRPSLGKYVFQKIEEVEDVYKRGSFPDGVAVDEPGQNRDTRPVKGTTNTKNTEVFGIGGIGETTISSEHSTSTLRFGEIIKKEDKGTRKNEGSSSESSSVFGIGGIGKTNIKNDDAHNVITFGTLQR